jgi:hypothetical protein
MLRLKGLGTLVVLGSLLVAAPAMALPFVSLQFAGTVAGQSQEVALDVSGTINESYDGDSGIVMYGAEAGVGLPLGFHVFGHYYRHTNEFGEELVGDATGIDAYVDMAGNEWGLDLEWHMPLIPGSPLKPFIGAGGSWARVNLDGEVRFEGESAPLETETDVYRLYGVAGLKLGSAIGVSVRGGMAFGEDDAARAEYSLAGQTVGVSADYQGYYVAGSVSLGF